MNLTSGLGLSFLFVDPEQVVLSTRVSISFDFEVVSRLAAEAIAADLIVSEVNRLLMNDATDLAGTQGFDPGVLEGG